MTRVSLLLAVLLAVAGTLHAGEEKPLPKELPPFGADKPLPVPAIEQSTTPEGMTVWIVKRPGFPRATVLLVVKGGSASDPKGFTGLSDVMVSAMKEGTRTRTAQQIADELQSAGADLDIDDDRDATFVSLSGLAEGAGKMIALASDLAQHASFPDQEVALVETNMQSELDGEDARPDVIARKAFSRAIFGTHPYSVMTIDKSLVGKVTPAMLRAEHARRFRPERALLIVAGDVSPAEVRKQVAQAFRGWKGAGTAEPPPSPLSSSSSPARRIVVVDRPGSVQSEIMMGRLAPLRSDPSYYALELANMIFGVMFSSRLIENIREDKGYTYSPRSQLEETRGSGLFAVHAAVRNEVTSPTLIEMFYELDRMWGTPPTDKELARAKRNAVGWFALRNEVQLALAHTLARNWVLGLPPDEIARYVARINAVTAAEVQKAGGALFPSLGQTVVIVGDKAKIAGELSRFGLVGDDKKE